MMPNSELSVFPDWKDKPAARDFRQHFCKHCAWWEKGHFLFSFHFIRVIYELGPHSLGCCHVRSSLRFHSGNIAEQQSLITDLFIPTQSKTFFSTDFLQFLFYNDSRAGTGRNNRALLYSTCDFSPELKIKRVTLTFTSSWLRRRLPENVLTNSCSCILTYSIKKIHMGTS